MQKIIALSLALAVALTMLSGEAFAKRFGGGKSFGKQREQITQPVAPKSAPAAPSPAGGRSWLGPLAGLAAGGLLATLFFGGAFDGIKAMDILLILAMAAAVWFVLRALRRPAPQAMQYAGMGAQGYAPTSMAGSTSAANAQSTRPLWFEDEPFLRAAKGNFIRLQDAYDRGDLTDIREFTTPEVFAEISLQVQERGNTKNKTDVMQLNATMADVVTENGLVIASVRFSGLIREDEGGAAQPFDEIWHIQKSATDRNAPWFIGGIQQVS